MRTITKEVKIYSLSLKGLFNKIKTFVSKVGQKVKEVVDKAIAYIKTKPIKENTKSFVSNIGKKIKEIIDIIVNYVHEKIDQFELWLYIKLEAKFADIETGLDTLRDELIE